MGTRKPEERMSETYTEVGPSLVGPDGSIEHGEPTVTVDGRRAKADAAGQRHILAGMSQSEYAARMRQWHDVLLPAARAVDPDFDETIRAADAHLDTPALDVVALGTHNGPLVLKWLAERPAEVQRINLLARTNPAKAQQRIIEISADIATNSAANLDKADFATYRRVRQNQIRNLHG
jgi:hypothetical protein